MSHAHPRAASPARVPLPMGSLLSRLLIRHPQPRLFSPRHLFGKECSSGTVSHTHPGGFAKFSRERFHKVAICHLWTERGNCSCGAGESGGPHRGASPTPRNTLFHSVNKYLWCTCCGPGAAVGMRGPWAASALLGLSVQVSVKSQASSLKEAAM